MKNFTNLLFLFLVLVGLCSQAQSVNEFTVYARTHTLKQVARELNNIDGQNYKQWIASPTTRKSVILFCDSVIDISVEIINDYKSYKALKVEKLDSAEMQLDMKYTRFFSQQIPRSNSDTTKKFNKEKFEMMGYGTIIDFQKPLVSFLRLDRYELDDREIIMELSFVRSHQTIQHLYNNYEYAMNAQRLSIPEAMQIRNKQLLAQRFETVEKKNFVLYQSYSAKNRAVKSAEFYMDNDFFLPNGHNQDREYTGGGALTLGTDFFKWRWLSFGWIGRQNIFRNKVDSVIINKDQVLTYQSIKMGMHFYTPYIRYRDNFPLADTLFQHDRPFGSYIYMERSKYRLWPKGLYRHQGNFQVGKIGTNAGRDIQALLHKDAITTSQKVYGWQNQVGNGGRWLVQLNHKLDVMLFSTTNKYYSAFAPKRMHHDKRKYMGFNVYNSSELFFGGYYTALGSGLYFSLLDFTKQSGQNLLASRKKNVFEFGCNLEMGARYRYVFHNSMLEGVGYTGTFTNDPYDDEAESPYTLASSQINRNIFIWETKFNVRWRKMTVYYGITIQNKEYTVTPVNYSGVGGLVLKEDREYYNTTVIGEMNEFDKLKSYGYGRFGLVWVVE